MRGLAHAAAAHNREGRIACLKVFKDGLVREVVEGVVQYAPEGIVWRWGVKVDGESVAGNREGGDAEVCLCTSRVRDAERKSVVDGVDPHRVARCGREVLQERCLQQGGVQVPRL